MRGPDLVIPSQRARLLTRALGTVAFGVLVGSVLQGARILSRSPLGSLEASTGLPVVAIIVSGVALTFAFTALRDGWNHRVVLGREAVTVHDSKASYYIPYGEVEAAKVVPFAGVVIAIRDREKWLASLGEASSIRRRTSEVIRRAYGGDILIGRTQLALDGARFVEVLNERLRDNRGI